MYLKQSTTVTIQMGPAVDKTDGVTAETALSPTVEISKDNAAFAARNSATAISHDAQGWYRVELNTTDTATVGRLVAKFDDDATHLPVWHEFWILEEAIYDALFAASANAFTGAAGSTQLSDIANNVIDSNVIATDAIGAAQIAADAIGASELATDAVNEIVDQVWDEAQADHVAAGSFGVIATEIADILTDTGTTLDGKIDTIDTNVDAILVDTGTTLDNHLTDIKGTGFVKDTHSLIDIETYVDLIDDGTSGLAKIATDVAAILVDTNSLNDTKIPDTISLANINAEVDTAMVTYGLDHLVQTSVVGADIADNSIVAYLASSSATADWDDFVNTTDSLQAIRDNQITAANVNSEVSDVLSTDTQTLPSQEAPSATPTITAMITYLYKFMRNKITNDGTTIKVYADDTTTVDHKSTVSESGGTVTRGEFGTGP